MCALLDQLKKNAARKFSALGMQRGGSAINVVIALAAGRKRKFSQTERVGCQQIEKLFA